MRKTRVKRIKRIIEKLTELVGIIGIILILALFIKLFSTANTNFIKGLRPLTSLEMQQGVEYTKSHIND